MNAAFMRLMQMSFTNMIMYTAPSATFKWAGQGSAHESERFLVLQNPEKRPQNKTLATRDVDRIVAGELRLKRWITLLAIDEAWCPEDNVWVECGGQIIRKWEYRVRPNRWNPSHSCFYILIDANLMTCKCSNFIPLFSWPSIQFLQYLLPSIRYVGF